MEQAAPYSPFLPLSDLGPDPAVLDGVDVLGAAPSAAPLPTDYLIVAAPRISPALFHEVLTKAGSPAAAENDGDALYQIPVGYGLDPACALAWFQHESSYGTKGVAVTTHGWGNMRVSEGGAYPRREFFRGEQSIGHFAVYPTYRASLDDWCRYLLRRYIQRGLTTVAAIVPVYAPSTDGNVPARYVASLVRAVTAWRQLSGPGPWPAGDPWAAWGERHPLPLPARPFAIPQRWLREGDLGAALGYEHPLGPGRAAQAFERGVVVWMGGERTEVVR